MLRSIVIHQSTVLVTSGRDHIRYQTTLLLFFFFLLFNNGQTSDLWFCWGEKNTNVSSSLPSLVLSVLVCSVCAPFPQQPIPARNMQMHPIAVSFYRSIKLLFRGREKSQQFTIKIAFDSSETPCFLSNLFLYISASGKMSHLNHRY